MLRFICAAVACFAFACGGSSSPQTVFNATLNGANETPAVTTTATGTAKFTLNGSTITWTASTTPLSARYTVSHIHLDTSFYGDAWKPHKPCTNGFDVHERVTFQAQNMAAAAPMDVRARNQLDLCIGHGTTDRKSVV